MDVACRIIYLDILTLLPCIGIRIYPGDRDIGTLLFDVRRIQFHSLISLLHHRGVCLSI
jgi:hypothetical protein